MITYSDIYEASRKERYSEQLQQLPKNFLEEVKGYLEEKKEVASKPDDDFSDVIIKTKKQIENAQMLFKEIMRTRRKKILHLVLIAAETGISKQDFNNMFDMEKTLFEDLMKCIEASNKKLGNIMNTKIGKEVKEEGSVKFKEDVDEFMTLDGKIGPFKKGDTAKIPEEIAQILIDDGKVEKIGTNG